MGIDMRSTVVTVDLIQQRAVLMSPSATLGAMIIDALNSFRVKRIELTISKLEADVIVLGPFDAEAKEKLEEQVIQFATRYGRALGALPRRYGASVIKAINGVSVVEQVEKRTGTDGSIE